MTELPTLSEPAQCKLDLQWEELRESHIFYLDLYATQLVRAEIRTGHLRTSYEATIREHLLKTTVSLAETRFQQFADEYLRLWASTEDARSKTFVEWLAEIQAYVVSEIAPLWATRDSLAELFKHCRGRLDDHLRGLTKLAKSYARRLEIQTP